MAHPTQLGLWLRHEADPTEQRVPIVPADAGALSAAGIPTVVEESSQRAFPLSEYVAAGCTAVPAGTWPDAPADYVVIGVKEPPPQPFNLRHRHIFFGHAYKGQEGSERLLSRFEVGGGTLMDLEYLVDAAGRRVAAFGFWAGYVGAALAIAHYRGELVAPLRSTTKAAIDAGLRRPGRAGRALVIGALGRSGGGACEALAVGGVPTTQWDVLETRHLDRVALLDHDILVNCVLAAEPGPPFLTAADLARDGRLLSVVVDVTCDIRSACNRLPVNDRLTDWERPVRRLDAGARPLDVIAIGNVASLLPRESSSAFSAELLPHLMSLPEGGEIWNRSLARFLSASRQLTAVIAADAATDGIKEH